MNLLISIEEEEQLPTSQIHLRLQQRSGRKCITLVEGLTTSSAETLLPLRREWGCAAGYLEGKQVLQFSGDQRQRLYQVLLSRNMAKKHNIHLHGY